MLHDEFLYFRENFASLLAKYEGKVIILKDFGVVKSFDSNAEASWWGEKNLEPGSYIIQLCAKGQDNFVAKFHSRVRFNR